MHTSEVDNLVVARDQLAFTPSANKRGVEHLDQPLVSRGTDSKAGSAATRTHNVFAMPALTTDWAAVYGGTGQLL
ncbi:hypothetical protein ON010_g5706 [Phytophthora cinnamomi]|nr:hypothetical protein ON010_g5706 [Phytophthora cinnamomi]